MHNYSFLSGRWCLGPVLSVHQKQELPSDTIGGHVSLPSDSFASAHRAATLLCPCPTSSATPLSPFYVARTISNQQSPTLIQLTLTALPPPLVTSPPCRAAHWLVTWASPQLGQTGPNTGRSCALSAARPVMPVS
jgi:hypothetical protein